MQIVYKYYVIMFKYVRVSNYVCLIVSFCVSSSENRMISAVNEFLDDLR